MFNSFIPRVPLKEASAKSVDPDQTPLGSTLIALNTGLFINYNTMKTYQASQLLEMDMTKELYRKVNSSKIG